MQHAICSSDLQGNGLVAAAIVVICIDVGLCFRLPACRVRYQEHMLGPVSFYLGVRKCTREDVQLVNKRGLTLHCSHFRSHTIGPCQSRNRKTKRATLDSSGSGSGNSNEHDEDDDDDDDDEDDDDGDDDTDTATMVEANGSTAAVPSSTCTTTSTKRTLVVPTSQACIIYLHGNSGCRLDGVDALELVTAYGLDLFCIDLSGSGLSEGMSMQQQMRGTIM
jgi:hypothetical protein